MIGATPLEAPGTNETWGVGTAGSTTVVVRYTRESGWSLGPALPAGFKLEQSPLAGQMTPQGDGVLAGTVSPEGGGSHQVLLVRKTGGAFIEAPPVPAESETLPARRRSAAEERRNAVRGQPRAADRPARRRRRAKPGRCSRRSGKAPGVEDQVLHFDGQQVDIASRSRSRKPATKTSASWGSALPPRRTPGCSRSSPPKRPTPRARWRSSGACAKVKERASNGVGSRSRLRARGKKPNRCGCPCRVQANPSRSRSSGTGEPPTVISQLLTVTSEGVWIDGERADIHTHTPASTTIFFKPAGATGGQVQASWCLLPAGAEGPPCQHELPEALPSDFSRSIAWSPSEVKAGAGPKRAKPKRAGDLAPCDHWAARRCEPALGRRNVYARAGARRGLEREPVSRRAARCRLHQLARGVAWRRWHARAPDAQPGTEPPHAVAGAVSPCAARDRAAARRAGRRALERSARRRRLRRGRALQAGRGAGCPKACSGPASGSNTRGCAPSPGRRPTASMLSVTTGRCGCGVGKPACGNTTRRRR